ncbi:hypothetical protein HDU81_010572 [Chytriomyces hyalinus]|nr:hypothetical protein HDU81_010572 [Chytriomyces hyalinus]
MQTFGHAHRAQSAPPVLSYDMYSDCDGKDAEFADSGCCLLESETGAGHAGDKHSYSATCSETGSDLLPYSRIQKYTDRLHSGHDAVLDPSAWNTRASPMSESAESNSSFLATKRVHDGSSLSEADYCDTSFGHSNSLRHHHADATNSPCSSIASSFRSQRHHQSSANSVSYESKQSHFSSTSRQFPKHEFQASSNAGDPFDENSGVEYSVCQDEDDGAASPFCEKSPTRVLRKRRCRSFDSSSISSYQHHEVVWSSNQECTYSFENKSQLAHGSPSIFSSPIQTMNCERVQFLDIAEDTQLPFEINGNPSQQDIYTISVNRSSGRPFSPETDASKPQHQRQALDSTRMTAMDHAISLLESENVQLMNLYLDTQRRLQFSEAENHGLRTRFKRRCNDCSGGTEALGEESCYRSENAIVLEDGEEKQSTEIMVEYQVEEILDGSNIDLESKSVIEVDDSDFEVERVPCAITTADCNEGFIPDTVASRKKDGTQGIEAQTPSTFEEDDVDELPSDILGHNTNAPPVEPIHTEPLNSQHMQPHELQFLKTEASETTLALAQSVATIRSGLEKGFSQVVEGMAALRRVEEKLEALGSLFGKDL